MIKRILLLSIISLWPIPFGGCVGVSQHMMATYESMLMRAEHWQELAKVRQEVREQLAEERAEALKVETEAELREASFEAQRRRWESEMCKANQEALQRNVEAQIRDAVESKVSFNVEQGLEIGELEVDVEELKILIEKREAEAAQAQADAEAQTRGGKDCGCEKQECGCATGLLKKDCKQCSHIQCDHKRRPEKGCGGPEALTRMEQEPVKRPIKPTEIPLKLPVKLSFGMQNPKVEETRIRREPFTRPDQEAIEAPCDQKPTQDGSSGHRHWSVGDVPQPPEPDGVGTF